MAIAGEFSGLRSIVSQSRGANQKSTSLDAMHSYDTDFLVFNGKSLISCPIEEPIPPQPVLPMKVERAQKKKSRRLIELDEK